jgi:hypothetical protein
MVTVGVAMATQKQPPVVMVLGTTLLHILNGYTVLHYPLERGQCYPLMKSQPNAIPCGLDVKQFRSLLVIHCLARGEPKPTDIQTLDTLLECDIDITSKMYSLHIVTGNYCRSLTLAFFFKYMLYRGEYTHKVNPLLQI